MERTSAFAATSARTTAGATCVVSETSIMYVLCPSTRQLIWPCTDPNTDAGGRAREPPA